jgi:hypothetical protein
MVVIPGETGDLAWRGGLTFPKLTHSPAGWPIAKLPLFGCYACKPRNACTRAMMLQSSSWNWMPTR